MTVGLPTRPFSPAIDEMLGKPLPVLDDGFVRIIDYMGTDDAIVQAARVSFGAGTKKLHDDRALIRYLFRHRHTTPFEMCELKLHLRVPMDAWRQWIRHRTASVNEYSTRYSIAIDRAQRTHPTAWRKQSAENRQGSAGTLPEEEGIRLTMRESEVQASARAAYEERLAAGVAREQARKDLPLSTYTEAYWKIDLHNLLHFLSLRTAPQAQHEIRQYAHLIGDQILAAWVPYTWQAFLDYERASIRLSQPELAYIHALITKNENEALRLAGEQGWGNPLSTKSREWRELEEKLRRLGLTASRE